jgi:signal transduction histidine kinase
LPNRSLFSINWNNCSFLQLDHIYFDPLFLEEHISAQATATSAVIALPILLSFDRLKKTIQKNTEQLFFKYDYDLERTMHDLAKVMSATFEMKSMLSQITTILKSRLKSSQVEIGIENNKTYFLYSNDEVAANPSNRGLLESLTRFAKKQDGGIAIFDELEESNHKKSMRELSVEVVLALEADEKIIGGIFIRSKNSGDPYYPRDLNLLRILIPQVSVAIQKNLSFDEIQKFNITLRRKVDEATKELKEANQQLEELDRLKDEFVSVASHELRTPMTAIRSYLWMVLEGKAGEITGKQKYYLERSYNSAERLIKLVNDMLDVSRIESGRITLNFQQINVEGLCLEIISELRPRAQELEISLVYESNREKDKTHQHLVAACPEKIKEVLINLIGNALKFTPKGGKVAVSVEKVDDMIVTRITDTGVGITNEDQENLFQKFGFMEGSYRTNQDASQGTGLGLYIAKSIIDHHQGKIWVESDGKDKGSTFRFSLPFFSHDLLRSLKQKYD